MLIGNAKVEGENNVFSQHTALVVFNTHQLEID